MTKEELLKKQDELINEFNDINNKFITMENKLADVLYDTLHRYIWTDGLDLLPIKPGIGMSTPNNDCSIYVNLEFKTKDQSRIDRGYDYDFGSTIDFYYKNGKIELNYGTCGSYTHDDLGQMSRAHLVYNIWKNEIEIICAIKSVVNVDIIKEQCRISRELDRVKSDIDSIDAAKERAEIIDKIKAAKYIAKRREGYDDEYDDDFNIISRKKCIYYHTFEKIDKVTDKSVITIDDYWRDRHIHKLDDIITNIKWNYIALLDDKTEKVICN